jgi:hypothetical protein
MDLRYMFTAVMFPFIIALPLRYPFFGAVSILASFVLRDAIIGERFKLFLTLHGPQALYITTFLGILLNNPGKIKEFVPRTAVDYGMVGFFIVMLMSAVLNGDPYIWYNKYIDMFFKGLVCYYLVSRLADTERRVVIVAFVLIAATSFLVYKTWDTGRSKGLHYARPYTFASHHTFGMQLVLTLPLMGAMLSWQAHKHLRLGRYIRWFLLAAIPFSVMVGMRTQSRSTYLGIAAAVALIAWYYRRKWPYLVLAAPVIWFAVMHQHPRVFERLQSIWTYRTPEGEVDPSISSRFRQMRTALRIVQSRPVLGIGPRMYFRRYLYWAGPEDQAAEAKYTMHCVPLLILCEEGIVGFLVYYGLIMGGAVLACWRVVRLARTRASPSLTNLAVVASGCIMGFMSWGTLSIGQPGAWTINIYGTVALAVAAEKVAIHFVYGEARHRAKAQHEAAAFLPPGAQTEIVFP